jgi:hypothetical protein
MRCAAAAHDRPARNLRQVGGRSCGGDAALASDRDLLRHLGQAGRQWSARTHGPEEVARQLNAVHRDAIRGWLSPPVFQRLAGSAEPVGARSAGLMER